MESERILLLNLESLRALLALFSKTKTSCVLHMTLTAPKRSVIETQHNVDAALLQQITSEFHEEKSLEVNLQQRSNAYYVHTDHI